MNLGCSLFQFLDGLSLSWRTFSVDVINHFVLNLDVDDVHMQVRVSSQHFSD